MKLPDPLKKLTAWGRTRWLLIVFGIIATVAMSKPILWPDGFGIKEEESVTNTVEKDQQGNITKIVETTKTDPGKTLWDWLSLLGVPITLAILGYWLQQIQQSRADKLAKEEVLQAYLDRISVLLIDKNLLAIAAKINSTEPEEIQAKPEEKELLDSAVDLLRARTLSILRRFENDTERKTSVIQFLIEAEIVNKLKLNLNSSNLSGASLNNVNFSGASLNSSNLSDASLIGANLSDADLSFADLSNANLSDANLSDVNLSKASLNSSNLSDASLIGAKLIGADLSDSKLIGADFSDSKLIDSKLIRANLTRANFTGANLSFANFSDSNLSDSNLSNADLQDIKWNQETIWPDKKALSKANNIPDELKKQMGFLE